MKQIVWKVFVILFGVLIVMNVGGCLRKDAKPETTETKQEMITPILVSGDSIDKTTFTSHFYNEINYKSNLIYCSTFQLAWNEIKNDLGEDIQLVDEPADTEFLNKSDFIKDYLDSKDYIALFGKPEFVRTQANKELSEKFPFLNYKVDEIIDPEAVLIAYAFLFKDLKFKSEFEKIEKPLKFTNGDNSQDVEAFGINKDSERTKELLKQLRLCYYNKKNNECIIELKTTSEADEIYLAKIEPKKTLKETYEYCTDLVKANCNRYKRARIDSVKIPLIDFSIKHTFKEFINKIFKNKKYSGLFIGAAWQEIVFKLNESGVFLKSEAIFGVLGLSTNLSFDKPFLLYMKTKNAPVPYLAIWIGNTELLHPVK